MYESLVKNPELIAENNLISVSLINQNKHATFGMGGLILSVPLENIYGMSYEEMPLDTGGGFFRKSHYSRPYALGILEKTRLEHPMTTVNELSAQTDEKVHNEIAITGSSVTGARVRPVAYFFKVNIDHRPDPQMNVQFQFFKQQAKNNNLPLVLIVK